MLMLALLPCAAFAHTGESLKPHDLWESWSFDPGITAPLALSAILYATGARQSRGVIPRQLACFWPVGSLSHWR